MFLILALAVVVWPLVYLLAQCHPPKSPYSSKFGECLIAFRLVVIFWECTPGKAQRPGAEEIGQAAWIDVRLPANRHQVDYLRADLDAGEAEALILAEEQSADWILLDETKARLVAEFLGLRFIGTIGLLLLAKQRGKISAIRPQLDELRRHKFYISQSVYQAVIQQAGE